MEDKVVDPVLDTHHCVEAVVGNRSSPVPASTGACLEAALDEGDDGTRRTRKATNTTKTTQKTDDLINASDDEATAAAMIAPVVLHFSEKEDDAEDPTGYDSPSDSDELEEDDDLLSQNRNKQKDKTGLSTYEKLCLANIEKNKNRLREMGLHKKTPPTKKRPPRKLKPKDSEPSKRNPMRTSRTSIDLASDDAGRVDDAIEVPTCMDASSMDASRAGSTGLNANTTEENPASTSSKLGETTHSNEYKDDFSTGTGHDSKENGEKQEVGTIILKKRKSRATTRTPLTNEGMTTNELRYVAITKSAYNPKKELDMTPITAMFGYKGAKLKRAEEFYKVGDRARVRVLQEIVKNTQTNCYGWTCIDDIQDAWKEAQSEEDIETLASKIKKCIHSG
jgi:hypothetical protein